MRNTLLLLVAIAGCSKPAEEELQPFPAKTQAMACPLCRSPAYLAEIHRKDTFFECGWHRIWVDGEDGKIYEAVEKDNPRMRARIAKFGWKGPGGVKVVEAQKGH